MLCEIHLLLPPCLNIYIINHGCFGRSKLKAASAADALKENNAEPMISQADHFTEPRGALQELLSDAAGF